MRAALWLLALFGVAVATALFAGNNQGTVTLFWPPYRVDLSLNMVLLTLVLGFVTLYAHCSRINASSGQQVRPGDPIAEVGHTGNATGPHLHFELMKDGVYVNPIYYYAAP